MTRPGENDGESNLLRLGRNPCRKSKRNRLGLSERLFEELGEQLDGLGLVLKEGTLVEAQVRRPPVSAGRGTKSAADPDAD